MDSTALPAAAATLLGEYYHYADLAEHVRALPEAVAVLGSPNAAADRGGILAELDAQILTRLEQLHALGLYPAPATDVEVTVNGVPITLPDLCREPTNNALPEVGSPTEEVSMHTAFDSSDEQHNGFDPSMDTPNDSGFFATYVRPYLPQAITFAAGAVCGVVGVRYFSNSSHGPEVSA